MEARPALANQATVSNIKDGGVAGPAFFDDVARLGRAVLESPKRHAAPMPPTLTRRPVVLPVASGLGRSSTGPTHRPIVVRATPALIDHASTCGWRTPPENHIGRPMAGSDRRSARSNQDSRSSSGFRWAIVCALITGCGAHQFPQGARG